MIVVAGIMAPNVNKEKRVASSSYKGQTSSRTGQSSKANPNDLLTL